MELVILLAGFIVLDGAALLWGRDSRDNVYSKEWGRLAEWRGFEGSGR